MALFGIATAALVVLANTVPSLSGGTAAAVLAAWSAIALACGAACAIAARRGLFAIDVGRRGLIAALSLGTVVTVSMASIAVATAIYLIALAIDSGALAGEANGPLGLITVAASVVAQLAIMVASAGPRHGDDGARLAGAPHRLGAHHRYGCGRCRTSTRSPPV